MITFKFLWWFISVIKNPEYYSHNKDLKSFKAFKHQVVVESLIPKVED